MVASRDTIPAVKILHLLSQTHLTGAEVYAAVLCRKQTAAGHACIIVSDTLNVPAEARFVSMSIDNRRWVQRVRNIVALIRFCRAEKVDVIHAHSRAASWVANIVRRFVAVNYVSTVHGRQHVHFSSQRGNVYGEHIMVVCEHIEEHLRTELNIVNALITVVRNGVS